MPLNKGYKLHIAQGGYPMVISFLSRVLRNGPVLRGFRGQGGGGQDYCSFLLREAFWSGRRSRTAGRQQDSCQPTATSSHAVSKTLGD